jgi:hypothetical protein
LSTKAIEETKPEIRWDEHLVFKEDIEHKDRVTSLALSPIVEQKSGKHVELGNRKVRSTRCLWTFDALDAYSNGGLNDKKAVTSVIIETSLPPSPMASVTDVGTPDLTSLTTYCFYIGEALHTITL